MFGLGGLRLGWGYFPLAVADVLNRIRMPFNVSGPAQAAGVAALEDFAFVERVRANNDQWHPWTTQQLRAVGIEVPDCVGNFVLLRFPQATDRDAAAADNFLKSRGIILRAMGGYGLADSLRLTIGTGEQMRLVVDALGEFMRR
jgi:histidinol-phosphate aminotransferase